MSHGEPRQERLAHDERATAATNAQRRDAVLAALRAWDSDAHGRAPIRDTTLQLWHTMVADALETRKRALETKVVRPTRPSPVGPVR